MASQITPRHLLVALIFSHIPAEQLLVGSRLGRGRAFRFVPRVEQLDANSQTLLPDCLA